MKSRKTIKSLAAVLIGRIQAHINCEEFYKADTLILSGVRSANRALRAEFIAQTMGSQS